MAKIKRYPVSVLVRLSEATKINLLSECSRISLEPAAYCRKAIEHCLKNKCVPPNSGK